MDTIASEPALSTGKAALLLGLLLAIVSALTAIAMALPHNPYIRYQQFADGDFSRARWVYERIHFDPTPIDVAIIGSSRTEAAVSAPKLEDALSRQLGRRIHVAGLAVPLEGRDAHYAIAEDVLRSRPETKLFLVSIVEPTRVSHPAFKNIAETADVLGMPLWLNYQWLDNMAFQPYRNMSLFVQSRFPHWFGVDATFNERYYGQHGTAFDTTRNFRLDNGTLVDREKQPSKESLDISADQRGLPMPSRLAKLTGADDNIIEHELSRRLARQISQRCADLVFLHMPIYRGDPAQIERSFYGRLAPVLLTPPEIGNSWTDFSDAGHLRRAGIDKVTHWLPEALAPHLERLRQTRSCAQ